MPVLFLPSANSVWNGQNNISLLLSQMWYNLTMDTKPLVWIGSSRDDLKKFPDEVRDVAGFGLYKAQMGGKHPAAKPLKGYHGAGVVEIVDNHSGNTYRIVYTTKLEGVIYVLHAFQKKEKTGIETPKQEIDLINNRLRLAIEYHKLRFKK